MTEEHSTIVSDAPSGELSPVSSLGEKLRAAREQLGMGIDDVSRQLCLSPRQVEALESNAFDSLPSPTFARGFIRNYAKLLQLDAESLLALYRVNVPNAPATASISLHSEGIPIQTGNRGVWLPYLIASAVLILAGSGWWLYMDWRDSHPAQSNEPAKVDSKPAQPLPLPQAPGEPSSEPPPMGAGLRPEQLVQPPVAQAPATPAQPSATAPAAPAPAAVSGRIVMQFSQSSWVRVLDGDGKELLNKTKPANSEETIEGKPPFKLAIGNINGAQVTYNGQQVDLAPHAKGNVARLSLE